MDSKELQNACHYLLRAAVLPTKAKAFRALLQMAADRSDPPLLLTILSYVSVLDCKEQLCDILTEACVRGRDGIVSCLLDSGRVDPTADSDCALRTAAKHGQVACLALLLRSGCSPHSRQGEALALSVGGGHAEAVQLLLQSGADAASRPGLLQLAVGAAGTDQDVMVAMLLEAGAADEDGSALCHASTSGRERSIGLLLRGPRPRPSGPRYASAVLAIALQHALVQGHLEVAAMLLDAGAPIDASLVSCRRSFPCEKSVLQLLDRFPANVQCSQDLLDEALSLAAAEPDAGFLSLLLRWGANPMGRDCQALRKAVLHGRRTCVQAIVNAAGIAGLKHEMPCCVMRAAVQRGHLEVVSELLSAGLWPSPSAHHCCADPRSCTARMLCCAGNLPMAGLLMRFGAAAHAGDALKLVACGKAPSWRNEDVVQLMIDAMVQALPLAVKGRMSLTGTPVSCVHQEEEEEEDACVGCTPPGGEQDCCVGCSAPGGTLVGPSGLAGDSGVHQVGQGEGSRLEGDRQHPMPLICA